VAAPELPPTQKDRAPSGQGKYGPVITYDEAQNAIQEQVGLNGIDRSDPAFAPPGDPLRLTSAQPTAKVVYRDIPLVTVQNSWTVDAARNALCSHMIGVFEKSGMLVDSILGDDRVMATMGSRRAGLFGREVRFKPANDSMAAKEVLDAWVEHWPRFAGDSSLGIMHDYEILMGFVDAQLVWDTTQPIWRPYLRHWHARYSYYHWNLRRFIALSQDGQVPIIPGNGKWVHHSRFGEYRSWIRGALRAVTEPWLVRHFALRDWARYSEKHGLPVGLAETPMSADPGERAQFVSQLANMGNETTLLVGKGVDKDNSYGYSLVEATDTSWEAFPGLRDHCDMAIVLALLFQNLTTEVKGGSLAATSSHMDVRDSGIQDDNTAWKNTLHGQVARPFAFFNFGDPELAPWTEWDVASKSQYEANAQQFQKFGTAIEVLRRGGIKFKNVEELRSFASSRFGLDGLPDFDVVDPVGAGAGGGGGGGGFGT
jgi:phage gp29-like protein